MEWDRDECSFRLVEPVALHSNYKWYENNDSVDPKNILLANNILHIRHIKTIQYSYLFVEPLENTSITSSSVDTVSYLCIIHSIKGSQESVTDEQTSYLYKTRNIDSTILSLPSFQRTIGGT